MITKKIEPPFITKKILSVFFVLLFFSVNSYAAISITNSTSSAQTATADNLNIGSPLSTASTFAVTGTDRLLLVGISFQNNRDHYATSVKYGSVNMTKIASHVRVNSSRVEIWGLVEADAVGAFSSAKVITALFDSPTDTRNINRGVILGAVSFSGVNQALPYTSIATSDDNSAAPMLQVPSSSGDVVFAVVAQEEQTANLTGATGNELWNNQASGTATNSLGAAATQDGTGSLVTLSWTSASGSSLWAMAGLAVKPTLAGGATNSCVVFKDTFLNPPGYSNNESDSGFNWKTDWQEVNEADGPTAGRLRITVPPGLASPQGELRLRGNIGNRSIERSVDLTGYDYAHLKFSYRTNVNDLWENADELNLSVTGTSKPTLNTSIPRRHLAPSTQIIDISNQISDTTKINFASTTDVNTEFAYIDYVEIKACSGPTTIDSASTACPDLNQVTVNFSKDVSISSTGTGAGNKDNYALTETIGGAPIAISAAVAPGGSSVTLTTATLVQGRSYTLTITSPILDTNNAAIAVGTATIFTAPDCTALIGYYPFDGGTITSDADSLPNIAIPANTAARVGAGTTPISAGKYCNAAYIPHNDNATDINAIDTKLNSGGSYPGLGDTGSINFWYKSDVDWPTAASPTTNRTLFDASSDDSNRFFLILRADGRLRFQARNGGTATRLNVTSDAGTTNFTAADWVHISVTWSFSSTVNSTASIYVNNALVGTNDSAGLTGISTSLTSLYIGDSPTVSPISGNHSAGGRIDELYIYNTTDRNMGAAHSCPSVYCNYRDDFGSALYSNNDGSSPWSGAWVDAITGLTPDAARTSLTDIDGALVLKNNPDLLNQPGVVRPFSLAGVTDPVNVFYTYTVSSGLEAADEVVISIDDGVNTPTVLETITGLTAPATYTSKISVPAHSPGVLEYNANMKISIRMAVGNGVTSSYETAGEYISFLYLAIYSDGLCNINPLDHIQIRFDGQGLNCESEKIYIKACATTDCSTTSPNLTTVDIETTSSLVDPVTWTQKVNDLSIPIGTEVEYSLSQTSPGDLYIRATDHKTDTPVNSTTICKNVNTGTPITDCKMTFYDSGFIFDVPSQVSCGTPAVSSFTLRAVRTDVTTNKCVTLYNSAKTVTFNIPSAPADDIILNGETGLPFNSSNESRDISLTFTDGVAPFTLQRNNVGQFTLQASHSESGLTLTGSTSIAFRPHEFFIEATDLSSGLLHNATATGDPKWKASDNFRLKLRAQCQGATIAASNYVPTNAEMSVELALPAGGANNDFAVQASTFPSTASTVWTNISSKFTNGAVTDGTHDYADAAYHEVGVLNLRVRDSDYLGGIISEKTQTIGRFTPHHFDTLVTAHGCNDTVGFGYSGQPFRVTATAKNNKTITQTTQNYAGDFARETTISNTGDATNFAGNVISASSFTAGSAQTANLATNATTAISYTFPGSKNTLPYTLPLSARDTDSTTASGTPVPGAFSDSTAIRSGRIILEDVFGPVTTPLNMKLLTEYYSDNDTPGVLTDDGFTTNTEDSCTAYSVDTANSDGAFGNYIPDPSGLSGPLLTALGSGTVTIGEGPNPLVITPPPNGAGKVNLLLSTHALVDGSYPPTNPDWLTYPWSVDCFTNADTGTTLTAACGTITFGLYRGDDRVIYWRELF